MKWLDVLPGVGLACMTLFAGWFAFDMGQELERKRSEQRWAYWSQSFCDEMMDPERLDPAVCSQLFEEVAELLDGEPWVPEGAMPKGGA